MNGGRDELLATWTKYQRGLESHLIQFPTYSKLMKQINGKRRRKQEYQILAWDQTLDSAKQQKKL